MNEAGIVRENLVLKPFQAWLYIVIIIHYKQRIAVAITGL